MLLACGAESQGDPSASGPPGPGSPGAGAGGEINATGERRTLCATRSAEHYEYVVDRTNGRCDSPAACSGSARHFASDAPGQLTVLESWTASDDAPAPDWFRRVCD